MAEPAASGIALADSPTTCPSDLLSPAAPWTKAEIRMKTTKAYFSPSAVMHPPYALNGVRGTQAQGSLERLLQHYARRRTPTEADASASLVQQGRQLGDVARYAPRFILSQHLRHVSVVRILAGIDIRERLAVGVANF
jgi:hypothetical protein